jgi:hypothetical protein
MRTKMRLIVAPVALIFGIGAMVLTTEAQTSSRPRDGDNDKRRCGRVFAINPKNELCGSMLRRKRRDGDRDESR